MAGMQTPVVMIPRYSCYSGAETYTTIPIDVTAYSAITLSTWRSAFIGSASPAVAFTLQESTDQSSETSWTTVSGTNCSSYDPGLHVEGQQTGTLTKRWFRLKIVLSGTDPAATCWSIGFLVQRES